ncbi:amidohydrolase [Sphingobacterium alkalisoli]|uniref:Amidohydrolase n=1 Tax=Sphingobacterium alkalisoli TaxID=1874115 RepID=A0A4U0H5R2_9SPHI|nr:amidohydrolase family protein [Sphingobacterium alkalisoli]TJY67097.1 amidohydrolase [Sphingobacterium alkalisoli]GGH12242.1 amidohydrolase [Sphingobacterium alkalisoli]
MSLTIDTHHHMLPNFFYEATNDKENPVGGSKPQVWTTEKSLAFMDEMGIDIAITSISTPGIQLFDSKASKRLARECNDFAASLIQQHPKRFGALASVPMPNLDDAIEEICYALDVLKLDGVVLFTNSQGIYLGDKRMKPLFKELHRRKATVFIHPNASPDPIAHTLGITDNLIDFPSDTTRAIAQMHYGGTFAETPDVKYIFSHAGGTAPYLAGRFAIVDEMQIMGDSSITGTFAETFRRLYWDTALAWSDPVINNLKHVADLDKVLFGTDFPYVRNDIALKGKVALENSFNLSKVEKQKIFSGNALELFPRFK